METVCSLRSPNQMESAFRKVRLIQWALLPAIPLFAWVAEIGRINGSSDWTWRHWLAIGLCVWSVSGAFRLRSRMLRQSKADEKYCRRKSCETVGGRTGHQSGDGRRRCLLGIGNTYGVSRGIMAGLDILSDGCTFASDLDPQSAQRDRFDPTLWNALRISTVASGRYTFRRV